MVYGLPDYLADNYGTCAKPVCTCDRSNWPGRSCLYWRPVNATTWDEFKAIARQLYGAPS